MGHRSVSNGPSIVDGPEPGHASPEPLTGGLSYCTKSPALTRLINDMTRISLVVVLGFKKSETAENTM